MSALATSHAHMRAAALSRLLLVVDEVHASDAYMTTLLREVIKRLRQVGGHALLMSATLGSAARSLFLSDLPRPSIPPHLEAQQQPYPLLSRLHGKTELTTTAIEFTGPGKTVTIERLPLADASEEIAAHALAAARAGARVLVIRNTVAWAVTTQLAVEQLAGDDSAWLWHCAGIPAAHHARFAAEDRKTLDAAIASALGKGAIALKGLVVVSTQTTEQSLDIDVDYLICDLCPMDVLLQRIGRLHRHERRNRPILFTTPRVMLLEPKGGMEIGLTDQGGCTTAFAKHGWGSVYEDLRVLQATAETLQTTPIIQIPADNRRLVEAATHPDLLESLATRLGERWRQHGIKIWGVHTAEKQQAQSGLYNRDRWLHDCGFHDCGDSRPTTRLGMNDRLAIFPNPTPMGPFQQQISTLTIPGRWLPTNLSPDASPETPETMEEGGFAFNFGTRRFHYDRLGLRPIN